MEITIHEETINHFTFHGEKKGPIMSHKNTLYHPRETVLQNVFVTILFCISEDIKKTFGETVYKYD